MGPAQMVKDQLNKKERLGTWVLSQAPGRFLDFFGYFHAALEVENHFCLMHCHMIHCGKPQTFIKGNRHRLRIKLRSLCKKAVPREGDGFFGADGPLQKRISAGLTRQASPLCRKYIYLCRDSFSKSSPCDTSLNSPGLYGRHKKAPGRKNPVLSGVAQRQRRHSGF